MTRLAQAVAICVSTTEREFTLMNYLIPSRLLADHIPTWVMEIAGPGRAIFRLKLRQLAEARPRNCYRHKQELLRRDGLAANTRRRLYRSASATLLQPTTAHSYVEPPSHAQTYRSSSVRLI